MRTLAARLAVAVALAVGAGIGVYLSVGGGRGTKLPPVPKAHQSPPLERATAKGIIPGYRAIQGPSGVYRYEVPDGIALTFPNACGNGAGCPQSTPIIQIEYRHRAAAEARQVLALTEQWAKRTFKPPMVLLPGESRFHPEGVGYRLKFFEITS